MNIFKENLIGIFHMPTGSCHVMQQKLACK